MLTGLTAWVLRAKQRPWDSAPSPPTSTAHSGLSITKTLAQLCMTPLRYAWHRPLT